MRNIQLGCLALSIALCMSGCAFSPGQNLTPNDFNFPSGEPTQNYRLTRITPELIDQLKALPALVPSELLTYKPAPYRIGLGDSLNITVWEHPELTIPAGVSTGPIAGTSILTNSVMSSGAGANGRLVRDDGTLFYPYIGVIPAAGLTLEELRATIASKLSAVTKNPQVDVSVSSYGSQRITVQGAFVSTAPLPITVTPLSLAQAVGAAGINSVLADLSNLVLTREGRQYHLNLDAISQTPNGADNIWLKAGDQIFLPFNDHKEVYVMGEVNKPGPINYKITHLSLTEVLGKAGGLSQTTAKGKAVYVIRDSKNINKQPANIYQLDAKSPAAFALASEFTVKPGDVVFVGAAGITRWNRFLVQLLPLTTIVNQVKQDTNL